MAYNREVLVKYNEIGAAIRTPFVQDNGINLDLDLNSGWSVRVIVTPKGSLTRLIDKAMNVDPDQTQFPDYFAYFLDANDFTALIASLANGVDDLRAAGSVEFDLEFIVTDPTGKTPKFPKDRLNPFGTFVLLDSKV